MKKTQREELILGALLHDIGKFWQRADSQINYEKSDYLEKNTKDNITDICPTWNSFGQVSHVHSAWTYQFFVSFENRISGLRGSGPDSPLHLAANHHRPDTTLQEIIRVADWLSSAQDRSAKTEDEQAEKKQKYLFRKKRLHPVFKSIFRGNIIGQEERYPLQPLSLERNAIFAQPFSSEGEDLFPEYRSLWQEFESELIRTPNASFPVFLETLIALLEKYTWCIPSSTGDFPDISLFSHLKTTTAIAICLYDYFSEGYPNWIQTGNTSQVGQIVQWHRNNDLPFSRLVCGDISGIQSFIYQISSKKAALSLKGRSFYLQLLSDMVARQLTKAFHLPITNIIYSSGGSVYLLVPNMSDFERKFESARKQINNILLKNFEGELYLGLGSIPMTNQDLLNPSGEGGTRLESKWREVIEAANQDKHKKFFNEVKLSADFFTPYGEGAEQSQCQACGIEVHDENLVTLSEEKVGDAVRVCRSCNQFIHIGQKLKRLDWIIEVHGKTGANADVVLSPDIPMGIILTDDQGLAREVEAYGNADFIKLIRINNTDFLPGNTASIRAGALAYGFRFYGGNTAPMDLKNDTPLTFSDLAGTEQFKRLGVLRMDIDNLGLVFQQGFIRETPEGNKITDRTARYSISRLSTLSLFLDLFFSGYINTIHHNKYRNNSQIIYSGGDDLFIVGHWNELLHFALDIQRGFREFTGHHPFFTLSGGIALVPGKFPIHRAADLAGEAEKQAKQIDATKNAFSFLGKAMKWDDFIELETLKIQIEDISKNLGSQALGNRLRQIYSIYHKEKQRIEQANLSSDDRKDIINYNKWRWRMVYSLSRLAGKDKEREHDLETLQSKITGRLPSGKSVIDYLDIPVRWAEFAYRSTTEEEGGHQ